MSAAYPSAPAVAAPELRPVGFARLLGVQLRVWACSPSVLIVAAITVLLGVGAVAFGVGTHRGDLDEATVVAELRTAATVFYYFWPIIGAVAGASAFTSRWALIVVVLAPRRGRWLLANLTSFLLVPTATGLGFVTAAFIAAVALGADPGNATAVFTQIGSVLMATALNATAGFLLGAALRNVPVAIVAMFLAPLLLQLSVSSDKVSAWLSLDTVIAAVSSGTPGADHGLPIITAALLWLAAPACVAWTRLRSSVG